MITAVGGEQQNPCGSNIASLFFVTQQGFAHCAGQGATLSAAPQRGPAVGTGSAGSDAASQQMITAVGGEQQNPCGSNIASLFFVTQQGFAHCAGQGSATVSASPQRAPVVSNGPAVGTGGSDAASQQMITAVGGEQQNPCGSNIASLFFVTQQGFAHCAGAGSASTSVSTGNASDAASQQMITAVGGEQQNPCGSNIASLFFVTQQAFAHCAGSSSAPAVGTSSPGGSDAASQQMITAVGGEQQNPCGSNGGP